MTELRSDGGPPPAPPGAGPGAPGRPRAAAALLAFGLLVLATAGLAAVLVANPGGSPSGTGSAGPSASAGGPAASSGSPGAAASPAAASAHGATNPGASIPASSSARPSPGAAAGPLIAYVDESGALATIDAGGGSPVTYAEPGTGFGMPAWSPDGSRIAVVGSGPDATSVDVFAVRRDGKPSTAPPIAIYRSSDRPPFYLYWTPDGRKVAFLATEPDGISLRIAPADGSAPVDGSGPGAIIRRGAPLYFDWVAANRLLLHVGGGDASFVGEVGLDGASVAPALPGTGDFRAASASRDGRYVAFAQATTASAGEIVVAARNGGGQHTVAEYGPAAFLFDPTGDRLATIAADNPGGPTSSFPLGPLRLIDPASGAVRTLLPGSVFAFFWAPDGRTIAALRLAQPGDQTAGTSAALAVAAMARPAAATPPPATEVRVSFVDVATGAIRSERVIQPASDFVSEVLPYFDQYALSHRVWSADSASILLPLVDQAGQTHLVVLPADGADSRPVADGVLGFWSP